MRISKVKLTNILLKLYKTIRMNLVIHDVFSSKNNYLLFVIFHAHLILFNMNLFGVAQGWDGQKGFPP